MDHRFLDLLHKLNEKTVAGTVRWQTTADEYSFRIGLGTGMVRVDRRENRREAYFVASLFDSEGREVDSVDFKLNDEDIPGSVFFLSELFTNARRSALNIDGLLDSMEKDLEAGRVRPIKDPPKDDIPF